MDGYGMDGEMGIWVIFPIIFAVFLLVGIWRLLGFGGPGTSRGGGTGPMGMMGGDSGDDGRRKESAMDVLRRRYAAGEITDEQFDAMRRRLEGG